MRTSIARSQIAEPLATALTASLIAMLGLCAPGADAAQYEVSAETSVNTTPVHNLSTTGASAKSTATITGGSLDGYAYSN